MSPAPGAIVIEGLSKSFGSQLVLADLEFRAQAGCLTAVLGPSGSGKTTLLRILAGFERPDRGSVRIGELIVDDGHHHLAAERRRVGYVSQEGTLFPHLDVAANVGFGLARGPGRRERVEQLLAAVGLGDLSRRYPHQLSGGEQQRVALARALAVEPRVVLLDEPFAALDAGLRAELRADVRRVLAAAGATVVLVTHDQDEALSMADSVGVIRGGRIVQMAAPEELYGRPLDADLAQFVGEANLLEGLALDGQVETQLGRLDVSRPAALAGRRALTVMVRPEQVEIGSPAVPGAVAGRVLDVSFHGHDAVIRVDLVGGQRPGPLVVRILGGACPAPGSEVGLRVRGPVVVWPDSGWSAPAAELAAG